MAKYDLSVLFRVIDKATSPIRKVGKSISGLSKPLMKATKDFQKLGKATQKVGKQMKNVGKDLSLKLTAPIALLGGLATKAAIDFESAFTGVRKTVEATEEEFAVLKRGLMDMALRIPITTEELFGIAEAAGQLGIQQKDILSFTEVMANLGATTNITANEAAMSLAKFANITGMASEDVERLGSTIVDLGNNTATTERDIVAMGMRLAGAGKTIGLTQAQIMSLAAALSSVGLAAEAGGTAFSQIMKRIGKEVGTGSELMDRFASIARKSTSEFEKAWKEDASLAIIDIIEGLGELQKRGKNVNIILDDMGFKGIRLSDAMLRASGAGDSLRKAVALGNKAWEENNALSKEAALRYKTAASRLTIAGNRAKQMAVTFGAVLVPALLKLLKFLEPIVDWLEKLGPTTKVVIVVVAALAAAIGPLLIALGLMATGLGAIMAFAPMIAMIATVVAGLVAWGVVIHQVIKNWDALKMDIGLAIDFIVEKIKGLLSYLPFIGKKLGPNISKMRKEIEEERSKIARSEAGENVYWGRETKGRRESLAKIAELEGQMGGGAKGLIGAAGAAGKSETDINIKLTAEEGTSATIEKVKKKKGDAAVSVATVGYVGAH